MTQQALPFARRCVVIATSTPCQKKKTNAVVMTSALVRTAFTSASSVATTPIPTPAKAANDQQHPDAYNKTTDELRRMARSGEESIYLLGKHRSNAMELVHKYPVIEVEGEMAICDGGGGALGHPLEYISLARPGSVEYCKYCALRYTQKAGSTGGAHH